MNDILEKNPKTVAEEVAELASIEELVSYFAQNIDSVKIALRHSGSNFAEFFLQKIANLLPVGQRIVFKNSDSVLLAVTNVSSPSLGLNGVYTIYKHYPFATGEAIPANGTIAVRDWSDSSAAVASLKLLSELDLQIEVMTNEEWKKRQDETRRSNEA